MALSDQEHVDKIHGLRRELNAAIEAATTDGLTVSVENHDDVPQIWVSRDYSPTEKE